MLEGLQQLITTLGDLGAIGTSAFAIFLVYCAVLKKNPGEKLETYVTKEDNKTNICIDTELKRLLKNLLGEVEKIGGNDLSHLKLAVDTLGTSLGRLEAKVELIETKLDSHDKQAVVILNVENTISKSIDDIKRLIEQPLYKR